MDLKFLDAEATDRERQAVDALLGPAETAVAGGADRTESETRVVYGGLAARERRHQLLPALNAVQDEIGWVSEGALNYICMRLSVPPAEAYGVATFYALLSVDDRPAAVAHVCDDVGCRGFGAQALLEDLERDLGPAGTERDGTTWMPSPCLGQCDREPAVFFQLAGRGHQVGVGIDAAGVSAVLGGGNVAQVETMLNQNADQLRLLRRVGSGDVTTLAGYRAAGGYFALARATEIGSEAVIEEVKRSGLRGRGGAAFPAGIKWEAVASAADSEKYLICNADESEPGTFKDRVLMEGDPFAVIEAMTIAGLAVGATRGYLYIRGEYPVAETRLREAIAEANDAGLLGSDVAGSGSDFSIEIRRGAGAYICGEETALMNSIEGHRGEPRNKPPFPTQVGLFGEPTVINNVETLVNVLDIVLEGGDAYAEVGTEQSTGTRLFCLSGAVARPGVYEVPMGTALGSLIDLAGGPTSDLRAVLLGGAAGGFVGPEMLDLPLTFEDARERGVALGSGVVMLFDSSSDFADVTRRIAQFFRDESCGQCVPCRVGTTRQEELLARHLIHGDPLDRGLFDEIERVMVDASICGLGHTASGAIRTAHELGLIG